MDQLTLIDWDASTVAWRFALGPRPGLTAKQEAVLACFERAWNARLPAPTIRDLMADREIKSPSAVAGHIKALIKKGWLYQPAKHHGYWMSPKSFARLDHQREIEERNKRMDAERKAQAEGPLIIPGQRQESSSEITSTGFDRPVEGMMGQRDSDADPSV